MMDRRSFLAAMGISAVAIPAASSVRPFLRLGGPNWAKLSAVLRGTLVLPGNQTYATAIQLELSEFDSVDPQAVAYCASEADVVNCLLFAQNNSLPFAARSGGNSSAGYSTSTGLVIDVSNLNSVRIGAETTSLGTGAEQVDVVNALAPSGLTVSGGFCPTVALGGFLQGGGIGLLSRSVGVTCDTVVSARVALASGQIVTASATEHPDLYWAIRGGGGGNFGVVTSYEVTPTQVSELAVSSLAWSYDDAVGLLDGWAQWLGDAPDIVGSSVLITLPDAAAGNAPVISVLLGSPGPQSLGQLTAETQRLVTAVGSAPTSQSTEVVPYQAILMGVYGCSSYTVAQCHRVNTSPSGLLQRTAFGVQRGRLFSGPPPESMWSAAAALFDADRVAGQTHMVQLGALGGAANAVARTATAFVHRTSLFSVDFLSSMSTGPVTSADKTSVRQWANRGFSLIDPYSNGESYQNFMDPALTTWRQSYYAENYPRLVAVKAAYDPTHAFSFPQGIG
jgi:hypothetical protein